MRERTYIYPREPEVLGTRWQNQSGNWVIVGGPYYTDCSPPYRHFGRYGKTWDELHPGPPYLVGGPFDSWSLLGPSPTSPVKFGTYTVGNNRYVGGFECRFYADWFLQKAGLPGALELGSTNWENQFTPLETYGATAWRRLFSQRSQAQMGVFIGEIRDLPRMLRSTAMSFRDIWRASNGRKTYFSSKKIADKWLNTNFGWVPFLHDLCDFYKVHKTAEKSLADLKQYNGVWRRRTGVISSGSEVTQEKAQSTYVSGHNPVDSQFTTTWKQGEYHLDLHRYEKIWYSGYSRYYIPDLTRDSKLTPSIYRRLLGLNLTPEVVWELLPWSWLIDWYSNVGDMILNIASMPDENRAARNAFLMRTTVFNIILNSKADYKVTLGGPFYDSWTLRITRKERVEASPFGFGLTGADFSARQWSILAALGLSRLRW